MGGVYGTWVVVWCLDWLGVTSREGTSWELSCDMLCARWGGGRAGSEYVGVVLWFVMGVMSICCVYIDVLSAGRRPAVRVCGGGLLWFLVGVGSYHGSRGEGWVVWESTVGHLRGDEGATVSPPKLPCGGLLCLPPPTPPPL